MINIYKNNIFLSIMYKLYKSKSDSNLLESGQLYQQNNNQQNNNQQNNNQQNNNNNKTINIEKKNNSLRESPKLIVTQPINIENIITY